MPSPPPPGASFRLAPHAVVLERDVDLLQVGVHPAVVVPSAYAVVLDRIVTRASPAAVVDTALAHGLPGEEALALVASLGAAGLLTGDDHAHPARRGVVRLVGTGLLGRRTASVLAASGVGSLYLSDGPVTSRARDAEEPAQRRAAYAAALQARHPDVVVRATRHWSKPDGIPVDLTLVVAEGPEVDRLVTDTLLATDQPHLLLRSSGDEVTLGPLVLPGRTSCVRCADLARRDLDPQWPWILSQLSRVRLDPAPSLTAWASGWAAAQALAFLSGQVPETAGHTLELGTGDHLMRLRAWPSHAECGCRWSGRTE